MQKTIPNRSQGLVDENNVTNVCRVTRLYSADSLATAALPTQSCQFCMPTFLWICGLCNTPLAKEIVESAKSLANISSIIYHWLPLENIVGIGQLPEGGLLTNASMIIALDSASGCLGDLISQAYLKAENYHYFWKSIF